MLLYTKRRNVQCFTLSLPQHVYVLSAVLFPRSRPAMLTNGYAFPGHEIGNINSTTSVYSLLRFTTMNSQHMDLKLKPCVRQLLVFRACTRTRRRTQIWKLRGREVWRIQVPEKGWCSNFTERFRILKETKPEILPVYPVQNRNQTSSWWSANNCNPLISCCFSTTQSFFASSR